MLDVPETALSVAVFVEEVGEHDGDLVQLYRREAGHRSRDAVLLREGEPVARVLDLPWQSRDPLHLSRAQAVDGRIMLAGGLAADNVARGDPRRAAVGGRRELAARALAGRQGSRAAAGVRRGGAVRLTYGDYGGQYVPETLMPALDELAAGWEEALADEAFRRELHELSTSYAGTPDAAHAGRALRARESGSG